MNQAMLPIVAALAANMEPCAWAHNLIVAVVFLTAFAAGTAFTGTLIAIFQRGSRLDGLYMAVGGAFVSSWGYMALKLTTA